MNTQNIRQAEFMGGFDAAMQELRDLIARHAATLTPAQKETGGFDLVEHLKNIRDGKSTTKDVKPAEPARPRLAGSQHTLAETLHRRKEMPDSLDLGRARAMLQNKEKWGL